MHRLKQVDLLKPKVIKEVCEELGIEEYKLNHAISHFFKWQRDQFNSLDYSEYLWNGFGTFSVIESRLKVWNEKKQEQLTKLNNKK